jgi:hypothetical protein
LATFEFNCDHYDFDELFQRLEKVSSDCLEENMIKIMGGDLKMVGNGCAEESPNS